MAKGARIVVKTRELTIEKVTATSVDRIFSLYYFSGDKIKYENFTLNCFGLYRI